MDVFEGLATPTLLQPEAWKSCRVLCDNQPVAELVPWAVVEHMHIKSIPLLA